MADLLGYAASCAVLATFLMRTMVPLRLVAILSNVLFLAFGYIAHIYPVFFLHLALLPINTWRLIACMDKTPVQSRAPTTGLGRRNSEGF
jgi:CRP/FNR family cyclic AMP-dependent transcriptional regulator